MNFRKTKLDLTNKIRNNDELYELINNYRGVVLGSDQVWNPQNLEMNYYTLNFVPDDMPKITYAPSFGVSKIPKNQVNRTKNYLNRIKHISVREIAGAKIIKEITGRDVPVVCDPTALLSKEQWNKIKSNKVYSKEKYIFCYFLGSNRQHRIFAEKIAKELGYKIISIQHMDEFVKDDIGFGDITPYDVDPGDFINLIDNSELVLTDSFHGTMFSIYYEKPFYVFNYDSGKEGSVNSRINSISKFIDISERRLTGSENVNAYINNKIDWVKIHSQLDSFRKTSEDYLLNALKDSDLI